LEGGVPRCSYAVACIFLTLFTSASIWIRSCCLGGTIAMSGFMALFIVPVWVLILVPLYLFVPWHSILWRWPICTACGALAGFAIMTLFFGGISGFDQLSSGAWDFYVIAAVVGGVTCLVGALTKHIFKADYIANHSS
jgi:hypothetical protein